MLHKLKPHHRPLFQYRNLSIASASLLFVSFLFFLLVGLSLPIIQGIYIVSVKSTTTGQPVTSLATELRFGVWGVCAISQYNDPHFVPECSPEQLGYTIPDNIISLVGVAPNIITAVLQALFVLLVLHLVAAALSFIALFFSLFLAVHALSVVALICTIISALLSSIVVAADIAIVVLVRQNIGLLHGFHFAVDFGPAVWLALVALICTWAAMVLLSARSCYCCGISRKNMVGEDDRPSRHHDDDDNHDNQEEEKA
jgi:hypothetical protein